MFLIVIGVLLIAFLLVVSFRAHIKRLIKREQEPW
jgi:hypothetical protein